MDPDKIIGWNGGGSLVIEDNLFFNGGTNYPTIMFAAPFPVCASIKRNYFQTRNSYLHDPVACVGIATNNRPYIDCRDNTFVDGSLNQTARNEILNIPQSANLFITAPKLEQTAQALYLDLTQFNAAAGHQDIEIQTGMPVGITYDEFIAQLYNYIVVTGAVVITARVGTSSGGQELLKDFVVGDSGVGDFGTIYGALATERGTNMPGVCPNFKNTSSVWVRLTAASGNLGDGVTSLITRGVIHLQARCHLQSRFIT
jgi:hypothetical protein